MPFLVLEYLIGADLKQYSAARPMTLFELRQVVLESCAGLAALHSAGLVHRDIKPANLWLRLPLAGGERFDPDEAPRSGESRRRSRRSSSTSAWCAPSASRPRWAGRFVAGTAGYIAPEQVLDPVELDPRSDVYALAGTIYNVTTGRAFFDDIENPRDRIIAHMRRDPFEDAERLRGYPAASPSSCARRRRASRPTARRRSSSAESSRPRSDALLIRADNSLARKVTLAIGAQCLQYGRERWGSLELD